MAGDKEYTCALAVVERILRDLTLSTAFDRRTGRIFLGRKVTKPKDCVFGSFNCIECNPIDTFSLGDLYGSEAREVKFLVRQRQQWKNHSGKPARRRDIYIHFYLIV